MLQFLKPGKYYLDYGPMQMTLQAFNHDEPLDEEIKAAAAYACELLKELSANLQLARIPAVHIKKTENLPLILKKMIDATKKCQDPSLTPMAAVAGSMADLVADYLVLKGATRAIVNNGGDIALRIEDDNPIRVGIASYIDAPSYDYVIQLDRRSAVRGIATSGLGGRSFTKGIAFAVVCLGADGGTADACATVVANNVYYPHPGIKQMAAEKLDPSTDIAGQLVTVSVEGVDSGTYQKALRNGLDKARQFYQQDLLKGAILFVGGYMAVEPAGLENAVMPVGEIQNKSLAKNS